MTSPKSDKAALDVVGLIVLIIIVLMVISSIVIVAAGGSISLPIQTSPSKSTLQARIYELETQVAQLSHENRAAVLETPTPAPTPTQQPPTSSLVVIVGAANVRTGPDITHESLGVVKQGQTLRGPYRTQSGWLQVCCVDNGKRGWISGELVTEQDRSITSAPTRPTRTRVPTLTPTVRPTDSLITSPPAWLNPHQLYTKYLNADGAHILATANVADIALPHARGTLLGMTSTRPELFADMIRTGLKIIIFDHFKTDLSEIPEMADWPTLHQYAGALIHTEAGYTIAIPEDRLKCGPLLVHEIAHAFDHVLEQRAPWFVEQRDSAYQKAMIAGTWKGDYAETNKHEYWAVAVERYFRRQAGQTTLKAQDPTIAKLVKSVFGDAQIPPCPSSKPPA